MPAGKILDLRKLLAERFPQEPLPASDQLITGLPLFDQTLGGLLKGAVTELISVPPNAGSASIMAALLCRMARDRSFLALIDGRDSFAPEGMDPVALRHLLWVRCREAKEGIKAADLLLRDGNFPLVILDLVLNPLAELRKIPSSTWYRLQRLVELIPSVFLVLTPRSMINSAQCKLVLENRWSLLQLDAPAEDLQGQMRLQIERAQPNKWKREQLAHAG